MARGPRLVVRAALLLTASLLIPLLPGHAGAVGPELRGAASILFPGLGQGINGDYAEGATHFGLAAVLFSQYVRLSEDDRFLTLDERTDESSKTININRVSFEADLYAVGLLNLSFYSGFGAYRDARLALDNVGYDTPAPTESLADLAAAPFRWEFLKRPTTLAPLIFPLLFALMDGGDGRYVFQPDNSISKEELAVGFFGMHEMVAVGEEAFFRGMLNNGFSSSLGETWGLVVSATVFGITHEGDAGQASALGAGLFGAYVGYLQQLNNYRIGQGVAIHFWWNFLTSLGMLRDGSANRVVPLFQIYQRF